MKSRAVFPFAALMLAALLISAAIYFDRNEPRGHGKKAGKLISQGQTVTLTVMNPDGTLSPEFRFTRP